MSFKGVPGSLEGFKQCFTTNGTTEQIQMLSFGERGKPENPGKKPHGTE